VRVEYERLRAALDSTRTAKSYIAQNRGYEKEQAREGYDHVVAEELVPALTAAIELLVGDLDTADVQRLAEHVSKLIEKKGL
jgi:hypothetical protein